MSKLSEMLSQARRGQSGSIGFLGGKGKPAVKPRAAALVIEFPGLNAGEAEAAIKAGANGLLFNWSGGQPDNIETLKAICEATHSSDEKAVVGLHLTGNWEGIERATLEGLNELGADFIVLPFEAPARLLSARIKGLDLVVTVPLESNQPFYSLFVRNLSAFGSVSALHLESEALKLETLSVREAMSYRAVRDAVRLPALFSLRELSSEAAAYGLLALDAQAVIVSAGSTPTATTQRIQTARELLEQLHAELKDTDTATLPTPPRSQALLGERPSREQVG